MRRFFLTFLTTLALIAPAQAFQGNFERFDFGTSSGGGTPTFFSAQLLSSLTPTKGTGGTYTGGAQWYQPAGSSTLATVAANTPAFESGGYTSMPPSTNLVLQSNTFGTTPWTQTNQDSAAEVAIPAPDGSTSTMSLTALADNATRVQTFTIASAVKTLSLYVKRKTGTGVISLSLDGGSTYTPVTVTSAWSRVSITQTLANPSIVIKIATSGDSIYVWGCQMEAMPVATSYIGHTTTATLTRAATVASFPISNLPTGNWAVKVSFTPKMAGSASTATRTLWSSYKDASNWVSLNFNGVILYAEINKAGTKEYVTKPLVTVANQTYNVVLKQEGGRFFIYAQAAKGSDGLGAELITNAADREFSSDTGWWIKSGSTVITGGVAQLRSDGSVLAKASQLSARRIYQIIFDVLNLTAGRVQFTTGSSNGTNRLANGTYIEAIVNTTGTSISFYTSASANLDIDNVSVKEVNNSTSSTAFQLGTTFELGSFNGTQQSQTNFSGLTIYGNISDSKTISLATP